MSTTSISFLFFKLLLNYKSFLFSFYKNTKIYKIQLNILSFFQRASTTFEYFEDAINILLEIAKKKKPLKQLHALLLSLCKNTRKPKTIKHPKRNYYWIILIRHTTISCFFSFHLLFSYFSISILF